MQIDTNAEVKKIFAANGAKDMWYHEMFHKNCAEREAYNEPLYSFDEYMKKNKKWLDQQWANMEFL
tara:strand:+ start:404 stop:601 length:198 start_codon:yes stop_codon:yes gene_type:complete